MKPLLIAFFACFFTVAAGAQTNEKPAQPDKSEKLLLVEASCGQCNFGLTGNDCDLAVRINNKAYFVDGTNIDDHGDAHAKDGFCSAVRKANVQGKIVNNRFVATYFQLVPETEKDKKQAKQ